MKEVRTTKKFGKKLEYILFIRYFFTFTAQNMAMAIGQQRSKNHSATLNPSGDPALL
jgi:hypothetical protein